MRDSNVANAAKESTQGEFSHGLLDYSTRHGAGRAMPEAVKLTKLRAKLGADPALIAPLPPRKGRRMYRRSYLRTLRAIEAAETKLAARLSGMSDRLLRARLIP